MVGQTLTCTCAARHAKRGDHSVHGPLGLLVVCLFGPPAASERNQTPPCRCDEEGHQGVREHRGQQIRSTQQGHSSGSSGGRPQVDITLLTLVAADLHLIRKSVVPRARAITRLNRRSSLRA